MQTVRKLKKRMEFWGRRKERKRERDKIRVLQSHFNGGPLRKWGIVIYTNFNCFGYEKKSRLKAISFTTFP